MDQKEHNVNKGNANRNATLTLITFEQLLAHYKRTVWEVQIAPTLVTSNSLPALYRQKL